MAFFLLIYMGIYASVFLKMKKYRFINGIVFALLLFLLMLTYSRSGYIGAIVGGLIAWSLSFVQHWYQKKKIFAFSLKKIISA